jgi:hypothetical protein
LQSEERTSAAHDTTDIQDRDGAPLVMAGAIKRFLGCGTSSPAAGNRGGEALYVRRMRFEAGSLYPGKEPHCGGETADIQFCAKMHSKLDGRRWLPSDGQLAFIDAQIANCRPDAPSGRHRNGNLHSHAVRRCHSSVGVSVVERTSIAGHAHTAGVGTFPSQGTMGGGR